MLAKDVEEYDILKPHFVRVNAGKGSQQVKDDKQETFGGLKRRKMDPATIAVPTTDELKVSAAAMYAWVVKDTDSNFRMLLNIMSVGGCFYSFLALDKTSRAWIAMEALTSEDFQAKVCARHTQVAKPAMAQLVV